MRKSIGFLVMLGLLALGLPANAAPALTESTPSPPPYALCSALGTACAGSIIIVVEACVEVHGKAAINFFPNAEISANLCVDFGGGTGPTAGTAIVAETQTAYVTVEWVPENDQTGDLVVLGPSLFLPQPKSPAPQCTQPLEQDGDIAFYSEQYCILTIGVPTGQGILAHGAMAPGAAADALFTCVTIEVENGVTNGVEHISAPQSFPGCEDDVTSTPSLFFVQSSELDSGVRASLEDRISESREEYLQQLDALIEPDSPENLKVVVGLMKDWVNDFLTITEHTPVGVSPIS